MRCSVSGLAVFLSFSAAGFVAAADESLTTQDLTVLDAPALDMMKEYLTALVDAQFARRRAALSKLRTAADWDERADLIRRSMAAWTGPFPPRMPLNAQVTGKIERHDYVMEKILLESRPGFLISANLYLPKGVDGRRPAVLNVIGHSPEGKATEKVQRRSIAQARKGFVALTIDAIGQGERQVPEYAGHGRPPGNAHQVLGLQAFLAGTHVFNLMAWDVIRAVDYLVSRPEVDPARIACTGCSGGGMMTTYILPFEPRITVAVPACNPNTWSHRVHAELGTDHEQVFVSAFVAGIDPRGDPLLCQVPNPLLIDATTDDKLNPPAGVWELSNWLNKAYAAYGASERFKTAMIQGPHGYNREQRETAYAWMLKWLGGDTAQCMEGDFAVEQEPDTWCTTGGNVYADGQSKLPHAIVLEYRKKHRPAWPAVTNRQELARHKQRLQESLKSVLGLPDQITRPQATAYASRRSGNLQLTPIVLTPEKGIRLPAIWVESEAPSPSAPVILYLHDKGKIALAREKLVNRLVVAEGSRILAVDLRGLGETASHVEGKFWDVLAGKPIFAQRVSDVRSILCWLSQSQVQAGPVHVWAQGVTSLYAAAAAALDDTVSGLVLEEPLLSFESVVTIPIPAYGNSILIPGILEHFDLPQIYQACYPKRITLIDPWRGDQSHASRPLAMRTYRTVSQTYDALGTAGNWRVLTQEDKWRRDQSILSGF